MIDVGICPVAEPAFSTPRTRPAVGRAARSMLRGAVKPWFSNQRRLSEIEQVVLAPQVLTNNFGNSWAARLRLRTCALPTESDMSAQSESADMFHSMGRYACRDSKREVMCLGGPGNSVDAGSAAAGAAARSIRHFLTVHPCGNLLGAPGRLRRGVGCAVVCTQERARAASHCCWSVGSGLP